MARGDPFVPQIAYPDLASIMAKASAAAANQSQIMQMRFNQQQRLKAAESEKDKELQLIGARKRAVGGDVSSLAELAPKEAQTFQQMSQSAESHAMDIQAKNEAVAERIRKRKMSQAKATLEEMHNAIVEMQYTPPEERLNTYMEIRNRLRGLAATGVVEKGLGQLPHPKQDPVQVQEFLSDEWLNGAEEAYRERLAIHADEKSFTELQHNAAAMMGFTHPGHAMVANPKGFQATMEKLLKLKKQEVSLKVGFEREKATKPVQSKLQTKLSEEQDLMSQVDLLMEMYDPKFTTWTGKGEQWLKRTIEASSQLGQRTLSAEDKQSLEKYTQWKQQAEQIFSAYRKQITGAQAAMQEISYLRENMINKDLSDSEFRGAIKLLKEKMARGMRLKRRLLREGFDISELGPNATDEERKQFAEAQRRADGMWTSGDDFNSREDRQATLQELKIQGIPPDKALDMLKQWGYVK